MHDPKFGWAYHFGIENRLKAEHFNRDLFYRIRNFQMNDFKDANAGYYQ